MTAMPPSHDNKKTAESLKISFDQLMTAKSERLLRLENAVNVNHPPSQRWVADGSSDSLDLLAEWFARQVTIRPRTEAEMAAIESQLKFPVPLSNKELSDATISLSFDLGLYLGTVLQAQFPKLEWALDLSNPRHVNYGQAVLRGFGNEEFNPLRTALMFARGIVDGRYGPERLKQIHNYWEKKARAAFGTEGV